ncbi:MAG: hypothetical protein GY913_10980 [Proteobacteria bacterium]|nr:hypothetical protein [Pseudomonadota bacterium]MCP4917437.1 hypothetical protein [Pseudomonadota bacterium]
MKKIITLVGLGAICLGLGLGLGLNIPTAQAEAGLWGCYVVDRLPDVKEAMGWKGATNTADGLNKVATSSPAGTILTVQYPTGGGGWSGSTQSDVGLICVKE